MLLLVFGYHYSYRILVLFLLYIDVVITLLAVLGYNYYSTGDEIHRITFVTWECPSQFPGRKILHIWNKKLNKSITNIRNRKIIYVGQTINGL